MNNNFSCIIVDDEENAINLLASIITDIYPTLNIETTCTDWRDALTALKSRHYDIVFLDISMPGKNGIDLVKLLPAIEGKIIFTTAHQEYALPAFKVFASGYILKPIDEQELSMVVNKVLDDIKDKRAPGEVRRSPLLGVPTTKGVDYIKMGSILFLEATNKCTRIKTADGEIVSSYNIGKFKELLDTSFFQIHRSFIINISYIKKYLSEGIVILSDGTELPVARNYKDDFLSIAGASIK